ncbi:MAG: GtrA family protein [Bacteroidales bacterium]|nr:GtrA family protein [Bacteroidales bacterium]
MQKRVQGNSLLLKFIKFGIVGASGTIVDFGILYLMRDVLGLPDIVANTISFTCAASSNYLFNRLWTFRSKEKKVGIEYAKFLAVSVVGLLINNGVIILSGLLWPSLYNGGVLSVVGVEIQWFYVFKLLAIAITTLWNFFGNMLFTFRHSTRE